MKEFDRQIESPFTLPAYLDNLTELNAEKIFAREVQQYPVLKHEQMLIAYELWETRREAEKVDDPEIKSLEQRRTVDILKNSPAFLSTILLEETDKFKNLFATSGSMRDFIFYGNIRFLMKIANERKGLSYMDRIQEGSLGLNAAVENFDYKKGFRFTTLAGLAIKQKIQLAMYKNAGELTGLPRKVYRASGEARRIREELYSNGKTEVGAGDVVPKLMELGYNQDEAEVGFLLLGGFQETSLETPAHRGERSSTIGELIPDSRYDTEREGMAAAEREEVLSALESLNPKQVTILMKSFGLYGESVKKLTEVAEEMGVSKQAVHQLQKAALDKLRVILTKRMPQKSEEVIWSDPEDFTETISKLPTEKYVQLVIGFVCQFTGRSLEELQSKSRDSRLVEDRGIVSSLIHLHPDVMLSKIGQALGGRDHSTILNQLEKISEKRENDSKFRGFYNKLKSELHSEAKKLVKSLDSIQREA